METFPSTTQPKNRLLVIGHYLICSIGLLAICHKLSVLLGNVVATRINSSAEYTEWALGVLQIQKPAQIFAYLLPAGMLLLYYGLVYLQQINCIRFKNQTLLSYVNAAKGWGILIAYLCLILLINLIPIIGLSNRSYAPVIGFFLLWLTAFVFPFINVANSKKIMNYVGLFLLCGLLAQLWWMFSPYLKTTPALITNDYADVTERTKVAGSYVDNIQFINQHRIAGLLRFDPRLQEQAKLVAEKDYIPAQETDKLTKFLKTHPKFIYDKTYHGLFVDGLLTDDDLSQICRVLTNAECNATKKLAAFLNNQITRIITPQELEFFQKNEYEIATQAPSGHYFHHHNAFLGSINEFDKGRPQAESMYLYGWLNAIVISGVLKLLGGISFANYIKVTYFFYPLYYSLITLFALIIFRNLWTAFFVSAVCFAGLYQIGFEAIHMAPGFNPIRHFFDIFVMLFLYLYLFAKKKNSLYLALTLFFMLMTYLFDKEFGIFVALGVAASLFWQLLETSPKSRKNLTLIFVGFTALLVAMFSIKIGGNPASVYYFSGVSIPNTSLIGVRNCLIGLSFLYALLIFTPWEDKRWKYLALFLLVYGQTSMVYYIWNPSPTHFYSIMVPWVFFGGIFFREILRFRFLNAFQPLLGCVITLGFMGVLVVATLGYTKTQSEYFAIFKTHQLYHWDMPTAQFVTTMDPAPFKNAVELIQRYSSENGIYIISKYDNLLPFLAQKYSAMPFLQTDVALVTAKDMRLSAEAILQNKPTYIFVDSDILQNRFGNILRKNDPLAIAMGAYPVSRVRVQVLNNLSRLFMAVSTDYEPVEKGQLITVYKRKLNRTS